MSDEKSFFEPHEILRVAAGTDRFSEKRSLGISTILFKVTPQDAGGILLIENVFHERGGPARHLHHHQDEWFYALEGEFVFEVGEQRFEVAAGESLLAPRGIPHVWAFNGAGLGRMLIGFFPARKMEAFFREAAKLNSMPPQDPELWRAHEMELIGPPLSL